MSGRRAHPFRHGASHAAGGSDEIPGIGAGSGDVVGPASATAGAPAVFDGTTGKLLKQLIGEGVLGLVAGVLTKITTTLGDLVYGGASGTPTRLAGNTTTTLKVLTQTGDGAASAAPAWTAVSGLTVGDASNPGVLKLGASGGAQAYGVAPSVLAAYVLAPVSALSLGTDYELCQDGSIIRKPIGDFGAADPPTNWSKDNAASGTFSTSGGVYTIANTTASASNSWYGGTHTTPAIYRLCTGVRGMIQVTHRIQITGHTTNGDSADFGFCRGSALGYIDAVVDVSRTGANAFKMDIWSDNGSQTNIFSGKTSAEAATGWWVRFWVDTVTGYWRMEYATGSGSIPADSAWTHGGFGLATNMRSNAVYLFAHARKAAGAGTAGTTATHWLAEERIWRLDHAGGAYVPLGGCGYTASTAVTTHDDCWVGTLGDSALNAAVQAMLTAALNQRPGDGATWEVAVLRSTTAGGYGAATWTGTGAVACTGTGAYVRVQLRATGTTTQGSVQIARLTAPIAA